MTASVLVVWQYQNPEDYALEKAKTLAQATGKRLIVASYSTDPSLVFGPQDLQTAINAQEPIDEWVDNYFWLDGKLINQWIMAESAKHNFDLVIKTASATLADVNDSDDWQLLRKLPCPLLLSMKKHWRKSNLSALVTVDAACTGDLQQTVNASVLQQAGAIQTALALNLHAAYVIPINKALSELAITERDAVLNSKGEEAGQQLKTLVDNSGLKQVTAHVLAGSPAEEISKLANKQKYDLVIMGSVGRTGVKGLLLGNTAEKTIANLREDLLVVKP